MFKGTLDMEFESPIFWLIFFNVKCRNINRIDIYVINFGVSKERSRYNWQWTEAHTYLYIKCSFYLIGNGKWLRDS